MTFMVVFILLFDVFAVWFFGKNVVILILFTEKSTYCEVKSGTKGAMQSMHLFFEAKKQTT